MLLILTAQANQAALRIVTDSRERLVKFMGKPGRHLAEDAHLTRGFQCLLLLAQQHIVTLQQPAATTDQQHHPDVVECEQQQNHRCCPHYQLMLDKPAFDIQPQLTLLRVLTNVT